MILAAKIWLFVWVWTEYEPLQNFIDTQISRFESTLLLDQLHILLGCKKCLSLWLILILTFNPWLAIGGSIAGQVYDLKIKK